jgi:hypothetical protein
MKYLLSSPAVQGVFSYSSRVITGTELNQALLFSVVMLSHGCIDVVPSSAQVITHGSTLIILPEFRSIPSPSVSFSWYSLKSKFHHNTSQSVPVHARFEPSGNTGAVVCQLTTLYTSPVFSHEVGKSSYEFTLPLYLYNQTPQPHQLLVIICVIDYCLIS